MNIDLEVEMPASETLMTINTSEQPAFPWSSGASISLESFATITLPDLEKVDSQVDLSVTTAVSRRMNVPRSSWMDIPVPSWLNGKEIINLLLRSHFIFGDNF